MSMSGHAHAARDSYASQAAKWKNTTDSPWKSGGTSSTASSSISELVLISELCSSVGQTSFPPRDALNTLLRHIHTLDHTYVCELLEFKLEDSLWQVVARALAVLDALFTTAAATAYLDYFSARKGLIDHLTRHVKQTVKSRAEKVYIALDTHVPTPTEDDVAAFNEARYDHPPPPPYHRATPPSSHRQSSLSSEMRSRSRSSSSNVLHMNPSPRVSHQHPMTSERTSTPTSPSQDRNSFPSPRHTPSTFRPPTQVDLLLGSPIHSHQQPPPPPSSLFASLTVTPSSRTCYESTTSAAPSAFSFLSAPSSTSPSRAPPCHSSFSLPNTALPPSSSSSHQSSAAWPTQGPPPSSSMAFLTPPPSPPSNTSSSSSSSSASQCSTATSAFSFLQRSSPAHLTQTQASATYALPPNPPSTSLSGFSFLSGPTSMSPKHLPTSTSDRIHDAFADLTCDTVVHDDDTYAYNDADGSLQSDSRSATSDDEYPPQPPPPISAREEFDTLKKAGLAREVILEVELPAGPMGIILDRTSPDAAILAQYAPLPTGGKGFVELHPAIVPGCLLVALNGNSIEHLALSELGPVLAAATTYRRVLTFKKFMVGSRVMHPTKLGTVYVPPQDIIHHTSPSKTATEASSPSSSASSGPPATTSLSGHEPPPQGTTGRVVPTTANQYATTSAFSFMQTSPVTPPTQYEPVDDPVTTSAFGFMKAAPRAHPHGQMPPSSSGSAFSFM